MEVKEREDSISKWKEIENEIAKIEIREQGIYYEEKEIQEDGTRNGVWINLKEFKLIEKAFEIVWDDLPASLRVVLTRVGRKINKSDRSCPHIIRSGRYPDNYCPQLIGPCDKGEDFLSCDFYKKLKERLRSLGIKIILAESEDKSCYNCYYINQNSCYCDVICQNIEGAKKIVCNEWRKRF